MENLVQLSGSGWVGLITLVLMIGVFILIILKAVGKFLKDRGIKIKVAGQEINLSTDKKLENLKEELTTEFKERERNQLHDEELRKVLFNSINEIDLKMRADEKRVVRQCYEPIKMVFKPYMKCEMVGLTAAEIIKDELFERVDYNSMREKLRATERKGYIDDILFNMKTKYLTFLQKFPSLPCGTEKYPKWLNIKKELEEIVNIWADKIIEIIITRSNEKIELYEEYVQNFILDDYKETCINIPIAKNRRYIEQLTE